MKARLAQVRALQAKLNIKVDDSNLMDPATYGLLINEINKEGLADPADSFAISGTVYNSKGEAVKSQRLMAFDINLLGAGVYRTVTSLSEIQASGGFEYLAEIYSDTNGAYYNKFYSYQFSNPDIKASVIIYAVNDAGDILGQSRLVTADEYGTQGEVRNLDVSITKEDDRTEYEILMGHLLPYLAQHAITLLQLGQSAAR